MEVQLEAVHSVSIRRKKPWPKFAWLGEAGRTELYMLDTPRVSTLSLEGGHTKRTVPALKEMGKAIKVLACSSDGSLMCGLLEDSSLFLWTPGSDKAPVVHSTPLSGMKIDAKDWKGIRLLVATSGKSLLLVVNSQSLIFVTVPRMDPRCSQAELSWWRVKAESSEVKVKLPHRDQKEAAMDAVFVEDEVYGPCWLVLWAYSSASSTGKPDVAVCHLRIQVKDMQALLAEKLLSSSLTVANDDKGPLQEAAQEEAACGSEGGGRVTGVPSPMLTTHESPVWDGSSVATCPFSTVRWRCTMYPLAELCGETGTLVKGKGSYVVRISAEGKIAAVVVNCRSARACRMVYVSLESDRAIAAPVYDGTLPGDTGRSWWIADAAWTPSGTLLVAISKRGSVMLFSRLSGPTLASVTGCSLDMGPCTHLPIHPLVIVQAARQGEPPSYETSAASEKDVMRQHFSVTIHPHLPLALCSDGFLVTALKLPRSTSPEKAARTMVHSVLRLLLAEHPELSLHFLEEDTANATTTTDRNVQALVDGAFLSSEDHTMSNVAPYAAAFDVGRRNVGTTQFAGLAEHSTGNDTIQNLSRSSAHAPASTHLLDLLLSAFGCVVSSNLPLEPPVSAPSGKAPSHTSFQCLWAGTCTAAVRLACAQGNMAVLSDLLSRLKDLTGFDSVHKIHLSLTSSLLASTLSLCIECSLDYLKQQLSQSRNPSETVAKVLNMLHAAFNALSHSLGASSTACEVANGDAVGCNIHPVLMDMATRKNNYSVLPSLMSVFKYFHLRATNALRLLEQYNAEHHPHCSFLEATHAIQHLLEQLAQEAKKHGIPIHQPVVAKDAELCVLLGKLLQYDIGGAVKEVALKIRTNEGLPIEGLDRLFRSTATQLQAPHSQGISSASPVGDTANPTQITSAGTCALHLASPVGESMVRSLGFLMARYFLGLPLLVPLSDSPCNVPAPSVAITELPQGARFSELSPSKVKDAVKEQHALQHWAPECALMLLLFASEWEEAALVCLHLGDWQLAYSVASVEKAHNALLHRNASSPSESNDIATSIIRCKIEAITKTVVSTESHPGSVADKEHSLAMLLQAAAVGGHDNVLIEYATHLVDSTVSEVGKLPYLVPAEHHLPSSPVFCQQRPFAKEDDRAEYDARVTISTLVLQFCALLRAANCLQPCFALHTARLSGILQTTEESGAEVDHPSVLQPRRQAESWERYLKVFQQLAQRFPKKDHAVETPSLNQLHVLLHRLLLALWYLHARDQLSALLRQSGCFSLNTSPDDSDVSEETVVWGLKLLCASRYLGYHSVRQVEDCVLTALAEMRPTKLKATLLAQGFPPGDFEGRNDAIGSKFARMLTQLRAHSVGSDSDTDGETYSSEDPFSVVYIMRSKALASSRQALSLALHSPDTHTQQLPVCESELDEEYLLFFSAAAEHTGATRITHASSLQHAGVHPFPAADTPLLSDLCIWTDAQQGSHRPSLDMAISGNGVKHPLTATASIPTGGLLWPQLLPVVQFLLLWSDVVTLPMVSESNEGLTTSSLKVSLPLEVFSSALHIREMKAVGVDGNVSQGTGDNIHHEDEAETEKQSLVEQEQRSAGTEVQEGQSLEPFGGDYSHAEHSHNSIMPATSKPVLLTLPQESFAMDGLGETPGTQAVVSKAVDSLPQLTLPTDTFTEFSFGEAVSLLTAEELSCTMTAVATQRGGRPSDNEEEEDQQESTTLSAVTTLTSEQFAGARHHSRAVPAASDPPVRYATGDLSSNPATESWRSLVSLSEGGLEEDKQHRDTRDHALTADGCSTEVQKNEVNLSGNGLLGDLQHGQSVDCNGADGAGSGGYDGGEFECQGGGGSGGGGNGGGGGDDNGGSGSLSSSSDSHSEASSDESNTYTSPSEHTKQQMVPVRSAVVSPVHPHTRNDKAGQDIPEGVTTTADLSSAGDLPCTAERGGGLPELPVSAVTVDTSEEGEQDTKEKKTLIGPPQSTPFEDVPQRPYPETHLVGKRFEGPCAPASPRLPLAPPNTPHCLQQEQPEGTTARFATLQPDELNSPTYRTWSSLRGGSSGHPVEVQNVQAVQPVGDNRLAGRCEEVAQLRRDVRKVVKQEMRAIVRELMKGSHDRLTAALDTSVSYAVPAQSVPLVGNVGHFTEVAHKQYDQEGMSPALTPANPPATSKGLDQPLPAATSTKQSGVQPVHHITQGVSSSSQDVFTLAPLVPSRAPVGTDDVPVDGNVNPAAVNSRARASFSASLPCSEDTASCVSAGERYSFHSELEPSVSELTPGQLEEAGSGPSQVPQLHPLCRLERDEPAVQCSTDSMPPQPSILQRLQGLNSLPIGSLPQLSLTPHPEEAAWPSDILQTDYLPQISLSTHPTLHTLQNAHTKCTVGEGIPPQRPLSLHSSSLTPHHMETFTAYHQGSSLSTAPYHAPVASNTFTFPQLAGTQLVPPSLVLTSGAHHLPPPPKDVWNTKRPTTTIQQLQDPQEHQEGAKDVHGIPLHSSTFPLLTIAPKQQHQQQSLQLLQLHDEPVQNQFPDVHFLPVKKQSTSNLPLLSFPDTCPTEKLHQAPGITCTSMCKPPGRFSGPFQLLQMPLKPFVPTFPPPDVLGLQPVQLQNADPFYRYHQEGFETLKLPDDMLAHGPPVHEPTPSKYPHPAHPRHGARSKRTKRTCTEASTSSAGDTGRGRKEKRMRRKPMSSDSEVSTAETPSMTNEKVGVKPAAEAGFQVYLDLRNKDIKPAHPAQEQQIAAKAPELSKPQKQFCTDGSTTDMMQQSAGSANQAAQQLTEVKEVAEEEMGGELARASQEVPQGKLRVAKSDVETRRQVKPAHPTQEQQMAQKAETVLQASLTTSPPRHYIDCKPSKESGDQVMQQLTQAAVGGEALDKAVQGGKKVPLEKHDSATMLLGQPNSVPTREFLLVEDIDPDDTLIADGGDGESTPRAWHSTLREPMATSSMSGSSEGSSQQHVMANSSRDVPCVATADERQAVQKPHLTVDEQPRKADDVLSKLKRVEAQLNALEATAYNMQREIKLDSYKLMGELVRRTAQTDSCASSPEGGSDVKEDRAAKLQPLPYDQAQIANVLRHVSSGSLDGVSLPSGHDKEGLQRLPHYKRRTRSLPGAPLHQRDRVELRQWMEGRRKKNQEKFKSERDSRIRKERNPFVPSEKTGVQRNQRERQERRRELLEEHREKRVHDAYALMADIIHDQPQRPREDSKENHRQSTSKGGTRILSHTPIPSSPPRRANRLVQPARSTWRKSAGSLSSSMPVRLNQAVKDHQVRRKPLRKIASVEGLTEEEVETITRLLKDVADDNASTTSSVLTDIDWTEVDNILDH